MERLASGAGFVRYGLGEIEVIALRDGHVDMPTSRLRQVGDQPLESLPNQLELIDGRLRLSVNAFLIVDGESIVLIDTGAANSWEPSLGFLLDSLQEAGVAREQVETVALTHTHGDHVQGLVAADGTDAFPNLRRLFVPREELSQFDEFERLARFRRRREPIEDGFELTDRITAVEAHGHEVGHTAYEVSSVGETLLVWGDIVHVQTIQFERPELTWEYDADQARARATRQRLLQRAARPSHVVAGAHLDFPGLGAVTQHGDTYRFTAL